MCKLQVLSEKHNPILEEKLGIHIDVEGLECFVISLGKGLPSNLVNSDLFIIFSGY